MIKCPICGKEFQFIPNHMYRVHNWTKQQLHENFDTIMTEECRQDKIKASHAGWQNKEAKCKKLSEAAKNRTYTQEWKDYMTQRRYDCGRYTPENNSRISKLGQLSYLGQFNTYEDYVEAQVAKFSMYNRYGKVRNPIPYKGYNLKSSYELATAQILDELAVEWYYEKLKIPYIKPDGTSHLYFTDFYLPQLNMVIEVKNKDRFERCTDIREDAEIKRIATEKLGYKFRYLIVNSKKEITKELVKQLMI